MSAFINKISSIFKKSPSKHKTLAQLEQEMKVLEMQLKAIECFKRGEYEDAIDFFDCAFKELPSADRVAYYYRGNCYQGLDRHPMALRDFSIYIALHPNDWETYHLRAQSYLELDDFTSQLNDLKRVREILVKKRKKTEEEIEITGQLDYEIKKATIHIECHEEMGQIKGEWEQSLEDARNSNPNYSRHDPILNVPKRVYDSSYEKAIKKGLMYDKNDKLTIALEYYDYSVERNATDVRGYSLRAFCLQGMNYYLDAIDDFEKAIILAPDDPNLHYGIGSCFSALKKYDVAVLHGERAIYWAEKKNPLYEGYEKFAKERGYDNAAAFYRSLTNFWKIANSGPEDHLNQIKSKYPDGQRFLREQRNKTDAEMDKLLRRRSKT